MTDIHSASPDAGFNPPLRLPATGEPVEEAGTSMFSNLNVSVCTFAVTIHRWLPKLVIVREL
jgi:hypothetical protein